MSIPSYGLPAPGPSPVSVCPRHPDMAAFVRCQTCQRPACGQCQVTGPTGMRCVECHAAATRQLPQARTRFGGVYREGRPIVTFVLIGLCVIAYVAQFLLGTSFTNRWLLVPYFMKTEPWTMVTNAFLHSPSNPLHLLFNMWVLYTIGPNLERWLGRIRFIALYLLSALGGSTMVYALSTFTNQIDVGTLGASGAIFGLFAAFFIVERKFGSQAKQVLVLIAVNLAFGFIVPGVSWEGHVGGLLIGALVAGGFVATLPRQGSGGAQSMRAAILRTHVLHGAVVAGVLLLLLAGVLVAPDAFSAY